MPKSKITEERMREIMVGSYGKGAISIQAVAERFINHPEIKSLFEERITDVGKTIESIVDNSNEWYEVKEVQGTAFDDTDPTCKHNDCVIGGLYCTKYCFTNGKQNFQGHESTSSIRCAFEDNKPKGATS